MIREIVKYGAPELEQVSDPVSEFDDELAFLASDMFLTMYAAPGVGLAAPQVGVNTRLIVVDMSREHSQPFVMVNPEIIKKKGSCRDIEKCLSIPGFKTYVNRPKQIEVKWQDLGSKWHKMKARGLQARVICHEVDHLDGILIKPRRKEN